MSLELTLHVRSGCTLCEDMEQDLQRHQAELGFALTTVDIAYRPELEPEYGTKVPVLSLGGREICRYFLDEVALRRCFEEG